MPRLHTLSGASRGTVVDLPGRHITIGRAPDNSVRLDEDTVSQRHAVLSIEDGEARLRDLDSTNGTCVNDVRIRETVIRDGDRISIGAVEMRFESAAGQAGEPDGTGGVELLRSFAACSAPPGIPDRPSPVASPHDGFRKPFNSRHHALAEAQVMPDPSRCVQCGICSYNCPAGIDVRAHAWRGRAIFDSHCLTCSECVKRCPRGVLRFEILPLFGVKR